MSRQLRGGKRETKLQRKESQIWVEIYDLTSIYVTVHCVVSKTPNLLQSCGSIV